MDQYKPPAAALTPAPGRFGQTTPSGPPGYFDLADIMQRAFGLLFSRHGLVMLGGSVLVLGTVGVISSVLIYGGMSYVLDQGWMDGGMPDPGTIAGLIAAGVAFYAVWFLVYTWFYAGLTEYTARVGRGEDPPFSTLFWAGGRFGSFLGVTLLVVLFFLFVYIATAVPVVMLAVIHPALMVLALFGLLFLYAYAFIGVVLAAPAVIAGGHTAAGAFSESLRLAKGNRLKLLLLAVLAFAIYMAISMVAQFVVGGGQAFMVGQQNPTDVKDVLVQMQSMMGAMVLPTILTMLGSMGVGILWLGFTVFSYQGMRGLTTRPAATPPRQEYRSDIPV